MGNTEPVHIFLVEDDAKLAALIKKYLERHQYVVTIEKNGGRAVEKILRKKPALVILDILLPGKDGRTICRELRGKYQGPIVMLTALDEQIDQIVGLEIGADEYITKPVEPALLLSKINAILRFAARSINDILKKGGPVDHVTNSERILLGDFDIHVPSRTAMKNGQSINLTTAQFDLFAYLARNAGQIISRDQLFRQLRGIDYDGINRSIDFMIVGLREKIGDNGRQPTIIKSIRGEGYLMVRPL